MALFLIRGIFLIFKVTKNNFGTKIALTISEEGIIHFRFRKEREFTTLINLNSQYLMSTELTFTKEAILNKYFIPLSILLLRNI